MVIKKFRNMLKITPGKNKEETENSGDKISNGLISETSKYPETGSFSENISDGQEISGSQAYLYYDDTLVSKLPKPNKEGTIFENRLWESRARVEPWDPKRSTDSVLVKNTSELLEEIPNTLDLRDLSELPLKKEFKERMREREEGLFLLRESMRRKPFLLRGKDTDCDKGELDCRQQIPAEKEMYYRAAMMINDRDASMEERQSAIIKVLMEDIAGSFREHGDEYDDSLPDNIESLKNVARWILEDADREHIYIDLDTIEGRELAEPLFSPFRSLLSDSAETGTDPGYRSNPIYGRIRELNEKISSSGVFGGMSFRNIIVASAAKTNGGAGLPWNAYGGDAGANVIMEQAAKCLFVERCTPRWHLSGMLSVAYQIYDLTNRWVNTFPYFCKSVLDQYMAERYGDRLPLVTGREDALEAAWQEAGDLVCADCGKRIGPSDEMYIMRRTYRGTEGSESFFCPECAERSLEEMGSFEKEGRVRIVREEIEDPLLKAMQDIGLQ